MRRHGRVIDWGVFINKKGSSCLTLNLSWTVIFFCILEVCSDGFRVVQNLIKIFSIIDKFRVVTGTQHAKMNTPKEYIYKGEQ